MPPPCLPAAYLLSWPTAVWCSIGVRQALALTPGLQSNTYSQIHDMTVTHLSTMLLSESVEVLWFVPKLAVAYMQASGCDLKKRWSCYLLSLCHWGPSVFCYKALRSLQQEGYLYFLWSRLWSLSQYMSEFVKSTVTARELPDEQQGGMSVLLPTSVIHIIHCCLAAFFFS